ncbi:Glycosyltransferase, GT2 family [Saccharicrinis carchari]|uniref:Glycosyltransferase, GT2 family n=1 Tax=Saccharicrinis carchari TaxID=1168039 RepID=A0A521APU0_SACCC|nr:glycosyltransferase [Saccharicrinis carchari]SMO36849.1 Glycosyltransferase, GT2 family [Saccharicrinis carchari]
MLSVCIPVFNYNITPLVHKLMYQAKENNLDVEILIMDDGSEDRYKNTNRKLLSIPEVKYIELKKNLGSAAIRNRLAREATHNQILFLDSDSDIADDFIATYIPCLSADLSIIYGGRVHPKHLPSADKSLRWKVGKAKEDHSAALRSRVPNKSFMSNNFLVKKELFKTVRFDETIQRSGHEDTMFGMELEKKGIQIIHIDNPVVHIGLESNEEFIRKTEQRLETLKFLTKRNKDKKLMEKRIRILKYHYLLHKYKLSGLYKSLFRVFGKRLEKCLYAKNPSMLVYDMYKLGYYNNLD